jgi:DNA-binding CsgD family transcriptional regulator
MCVARFNAQESSDDDADLDILLAEADDIEDDLMRCRVLNLAAMASFGASTRSVQCWSKALDAADRTGISELQGSVAAGLAAAHLLTGSREEGERLAAELLNNPDPGTAVIAMQMIMRLSVERGQYAEARRLVERLESTPTFQSGPFVSRCSVAAQGAWLGLVQGSDSGQHLAVEPLLAEARRRRFPLGIRLVGWVPGVAALLRGDTATAVPELIAWLSTDSGDTGLARLRPFGVYALLAAERFDDARVAVDSIRRSQREPYTIIEQLLVHVDGLLARASGDLAGAERLHHEALAMQYTGGWRPDLIHTLEALVGIAAASESYVEAARLAGAAQVLRDSMGHVLRWPFEQRLLDSAMSAGRTALGDEEFDQSFREGKSLDCDAAVAYATRARGERRRPTTGWASLTPTEADVARLAGEGLTNKQIAARLLMGSETVKTHLSRVYDKLHVRTRAALANVVPTEARR